MISISPLAEASYLRQVVDALPAPLFVVDSDLRILDQNAAAVEFCGKRDVAEHTRLCGDILRCAHAAQSGKMCGTTPFCPECVLRASVNSACNNQPVVRRWARLQRLHESVLHEVCLLVSATRFPAGDRQYVLLVLEDVTELAELRALLPVCSGCGQVRTGDDYWQNVHSYLRKHTALRLTHGLCPACAERTA